MIRPAAAILFLLAACSQPVSEDRSVLVRAYGEPLFRDEVLKIIPESANPEDSAFIAEGYIRNWITERAVLYQAESSLPDSQKDFEEALQKHRQALVTHAYEEQLIRQRLDTVVAKTEIESFYQENAENLLLKDYILRVRFCVLDSGDWDAGEFRELFENSEDENQEVLEAFCHRYRGACFLEEDRWIYLVDLMEEIPLNIEDPDAFLKKDKSVEFEHGNQVIFLRILDVMSPGDISPLPLQKDKIRGMILNRRKAELLNHMREEVYRQALKKNQIEYVD